MSKGRYRMMWTILADLVGLALSYAYGVIVPAWVGSWLPKPLSTHALKLYEHIITLLSHPRFLNSAFLPNTGLIWLAIAILFRLVYLLLYVRRRAQSKDLAKAHSGSPGDHYWETVQQRFKDYRGALERWKPKIALRTPTWRYYKRLYTSQPDMYWRGRTLMIEKRLLSSDLVQELGPCLARELMYYNCEDIAFMDILASYPDHLTRRLFMWNLLGFYVSFPVILAKSLLWPSYWTERIKVADEYAYALGQGHLLHYHIDMQIRQEEALQEERSGIAREIAQLEQQSQVFENQASIRDWSLPDEDTRAYSYETYHNTAGSQERFWRVWNRLSVRISELRKRDLQLGIQELKAHSVRPMLEERRGQLAARLGTEQSWMEKRGITTPLSTAPLLSKEPPPRLLPSESNGRT
jgi:hypothetical protein